MTLDEKQIGALVSAFSSFEANTFKIYIQSVKERIAYEYLDKKDITEYDRGVLAGYLQFIDFLTGQIQTCTEKKEIEKQTPTQTHCDPEMEALKALLKS
jgi:hypothetical protein